MLNKYLLRFLKPENYTSAIKRGNKALKIIKLLRRKYHAAEINFIWEVLPEPKNNITFAGAFSQYYVFSKVINLDSIEWHKDVSSGYIYPLVRIDKLKIGRLYNKGIDMLYVWVQSRFQFAVNLAQLYLDTLDKKYYFQFRELVLNWIEKNPFLYGMNWFTPMEAAIRAINWITAINLFGKIFESDKEFRQTLSISLQQHAEYISCLPEIYKNGHTTNHTTADYTGLLFIALTLKQLPESDKWLRQAVNGLTSCIDYQVYEDGSSFEGSIPYHRLVLELFAFSAIICKAQNISLPVRYYSTLFKMFKFTSAYLDKNGNAPCIGDDDSGRILVFNKPDECNFYNHNSNHLYLLEIGEHIFNVKFLSDTPSTANISVKYLPVINKINPANIGIQPAGTKKTISFDKGGAYILKTSRLDFLLACVPIGQNTVGGHNHLDQGSFTLSVDGTQLIVDAGTCVYSPDKSKRDQFRSYQYHNTLYNSFDTDYNFNDTGIWETRDLYSSVISSHDSNNIEIKIKSKNDPALRKRSFHIEENLLQITDNYEGTFFTRLNFHPDIEIISSGKSGIVTNMCKIFIEGEESFFISDFEYSPFYQKIIKSKYLNVQAKNNLKIIIKV